LSPQGALGGVVRIVLILTVALIKNILYL